MSPNETAQPLPIPARIALRVWCAILHETARTLKHRAGSGRRTDPRGAAAMRSKAPGRLHVASLISEAASEVNRLIADPAAYQGRTVDAAVVGYLAGALCHDQTCIRELRAELVDLGWPPDEVAALEFGKPLELVRAVLQRGS